MCRVAISKLTAYHFETTHFFSFKGMLSLRTTSGVNCRPGDAISGLTGPPTSAFGLVGIPVVRNFCGIVFSVFVLLRICYIIVRLDLSHRGHHGYAIGHGT